MKRPFVLLTLLLTGSCLMIGCAQLVPGPTDGAEEPDVQPGIQDAPDTAPNHGPDSSITEAEPQDGPVHLYYEDPFMEDGWMRVTMRLGEDDGYKFVSHVRWNWTDVPNA